MHALSADGSHAAGSVACDSQLRLLRSCSSTVALLGVLTALLHGDAALAADPTDLSQHHHAAHAVFGAHPSLGMNGHFAQACTCPAALHVLAMCHTVFVASLLDMSSLSGKCVCRLYQLDV